MQGTDHRFDPAAHDTLSPPARLLPWAIVLAVAAAAFGLSLSSAMEEPREAMTAPHPIAARG